MELRLFNKTELAEFVRSGEYEQLKDLPISRHRALSQAKNPRAKDEDILLITAFKDGELAGYLGLLPDKLFLSDGSSYKVAWFSCIWVGPSARGKGLADQMIQKALELWEKRNLMTEIVPAITKIYDRTGAFETTSLKGIRLYVRMDMHTILPPKKKIFQQLKGLIKLGDAVTNLFMDLRFVSASKKLPSLKLEYINEIDQEAERFIDTYQEKSLFKRGKTELDWMLKNPWLLSAPEDEYSKRYYFSSVDKLFEMHCIKVKNEKDKLIAFIILSRRNRIMKIPYCYCSEEAAADVVKIIDHHIVKWKINTFTTYHPLLVKYLSENKAIGFHKKFVDREYYLSKLFANEVINGNYHIQDGDGDCAFT